jgi:PadR family transcriptional regulator, regulatory protein PadR
LFYIVIHMARANFIGFLEQMVLLALVHLGPNAYGVTVRREIEERTGRSLSIGAIYTTLQRLEAKGYVSSSVGEPSAERGGRAKRMFRIEAAGERALHAAETALAQMTAGLKRARKAR